MIKSIDPSSLSQPDLHNILLTAIAPRPICFASTVDAQGNVNLSPFSFFNVFSSNPPIMIFSPARSGRDNTTKHSYQNVLEVKETVINIVNYKMVEQMSLASTAYEKGVNEFIKAGFTQVESSLVQPPRVGEAPVAFECKVDNVIELGDGPGAGNLIIARVVMIHINENYLDEKGDLDTVKLDLVARMGGSWYCRAIKKSLFEIPKPISTLGIGIDQLPDSIRNSDVLTGNNLGRLGNVESLPEEKDVMSLLELEEIQTIIQDIPKGNELKTAIHKVAKTWLKNGNTHQALRLLMLYDKL